MTDCADWFVSNKRYSVPDFAIDDDHRRCLNTLAALTAPSGLYNLSTPCPVIDAIKTYPWGGVSALIVSDMATHDFGQLTNLVLAAHQNYVRVQISPWRPHHDDRERAQAVVDERNGYILEGFIPFDDDDEPDLYDVDSPEIGVSVIEITLHPKKAVAESEHRWESHPGLEDLIQKCQDRLALSPLG
jgi:hypothetical protein